jgi:hypothetical protein
MKLLLKDEKYKTETIDILAQLYSDAALSGDHQVRTTLIIQNYISAHPNNKILYRYMYMCTHLNNMCVQARVYM